MSIIVKDNVFTLQTVNTTYQMKVDEHQVLLHLYYGKRIQESMEYLLTFYDRGFSGNIYDAGMDRTYSLDVLPQEYASFGNGDYRNTCLSIRYADGTYSTDLRFHSYEIIKGKYNLSGLPAVYAKEQEAMTLKITLADPVTDVQVDLMYGVLEEQDIITRSATIRNAGSRDIVVKKAASASIDFLYGTYDLISFYGRHAMERNVQRSEIVHGTQVIGSRRGTSGHQYNPAVILAQKDTTEEHGECYGMVFVYSGNFKLEAEKDQYDQTRVIMGLQEDLFEYRLGMNERLEIPETILAYSDQGLSHLSHIFHACMKKNLCRGRYKESIRPVLVNSWEAAYFDFDGNTLIELAKEAAGLGIDMVVMDDGWFGKREDDNCSLGDWTVNEAKLGCTLKELTEQINTLGVKFGIWFEPEMISEDSELYRQHPEWALVIPKRAPVRSRNQLVLDLTKREVRDHIFEKICKILDAGNIEYVKWDMNRSLCDIYSDITEIGKVTYEYVKGVYDILERLLEKYPNILFEGCSGGGGRFDAGMLYYTPQIWCSDNTDAINRTKIQYGTSFIYPIATVGSHVSAVPNHQTGRSVSLQTRGIVAMAGTFGYELDLRKLTVEEKEEITEQVKKYKRDAELILNGQYYRLSGADEKRYCAWEFVSEDQKKILINVVMLEIEGNMTVVYVKGKGLDPEAVYRETVTKKRYCGAAIMAAGFPLPIEQQEYASYQIELEKVTN